MKKYLLIIAVVGVVVATAVFWLIAKKPLTKEETTPEIKEQMASDKISGMGEQIFEKVGENPAAKMPEINPFNKEINPLENIYKNPFE